MRQLKITKSITNRETASFDKYLQDISKEELITVEQEIILAQKARSGDQKAIDKLCRANLRFVVSVAKQYQNQGLSLPDLINEGNLGLIKATQRFDETRGFKFVSYAVWWIRQSILQALAEKSRIVRLPMSKITSLQKIKKTMSRFEQEFERFPSAKELMGTLEIPEDKIDELLSLSSYYISTDAPLTEGDEDTFLDIFPNEESTSPEKEIMQESLRKDIDISLSFLPEKEKKIVEKYFGLKSAPMTLEEIGKEFDLTRERVRQIKDNAIRRLKRQSRSKNLRAYL